MWGALSDERTGLPFTIAAGPRQRSHSREFTVSDSRLPNLEGQVPVFIFPRNRGGPVIHPQALDSLFVASYDSQGYDGGIRPRLHTGSMPYQLRVLPLQLRNEPNRDHHLQHFPYYSVFIRCRGNVC
jgi:hypothetical protein